MNIGLLLQCIGAGMVGWSVTGLVIAPVVEKVQHWQIMRHNRKKWLD